MGGKNQQFCNFAFLFLFTSVKLSAWAWVPRIGVDLTLTDSCRPEFLEDGIIAKRGDLQQVEAFTADFFERCERQYKNRGQSTWLTLIRMGKLDYNFEEMTGIRKVEFLDQKDQVVRPGLLAMQPGNKKRPLVIYQCGVQCDLGDPSMRSAMIALYDTGVFHVLALPSSTGYNYQKQNGVLAIGGVDEGRQLMRIALMLKGNGFPHVGKISDVHLIGASLGGHSALFASLYADHYERLNRRRPFDSVLAACPVVRLQQSIENITRKSLVGRFFYSSFVSQLVNLFDETPILRELIPTNRGFKPKYAELRQIIANGALDYYKTKTSDPTWGLSPLENTRIATVEDLWRTNDYAEYGHKQKLRPVFVINSKDDPVVLSKDNTEYLAEVDAEHAYRRLYKLLTPRGNHCMFEAAYGWQTAGAFMRGFFLSQSHDYARMRQRRSLSISPERVPENFRTRLGEKRTWLEWRVNQQSNRVELHSYFRGKDCLPDGKLHNANCFRSTAMPFSFEELNLTDWIPKNESEAQALARKLNTNYRVYGPNNSYIRANEDPSRIEMVIY